MDKAEKIRKGQLKCWCCGECVTEQFALVSMLEETDKLFVMTVAHAERAQDVRFKLIVAREVANVDC